MDTFLDWVVTGVLLVTICVVVVVVGLTFIDPPPKRLPCYNVHMTFESHDGTIDKAIVGRVCKDTKE